MITIKTMLMLTPCGDMFITWMMTTNGIKVQVVSTTQAYILCKERLDTTMFYLLMMQVDIAELDIGKLTLIRKLCLLLSPAPPHPTHQEDKQTQTPPPRPPPPPLTPRPDSRPPENSHNKPTPKEEGTDGDRPVGPGERPKRIKGGDRGPSPGRGRGRGRGSDPDLGPDPGPIPGPGLNRLTSRNTDSDPEGKCPSSLPPPPPPPPQPTTPPEGQGEGHPPPPPPPPNGHDGHEEGPLEGAVGGGDGHPPPPPAPPNGHEESQSLLGNVASLLTTWESLFNQLVQEIQVDLEDYWTKLSIPQ